MNKLITYFKAGKGRGLRAMLIFTVLIGLLSWGISYTLFNQIEKYPALQRFIEQLPEITIENGEIISPKDVNAVYPFEGVPVNLFLQTGQDYPSPDAEDGFYLTKKIFAVVINGQMQPISPLMDKGLINSEKIKALVHNFVVWVPVFLGILYFIILWLFYIILVGISSLIALICRLHLNKGATWRTNAFSVITVMLICILMGFLGYMLPPVVIYGITCPLLSQMILCSILTLIILVGIRNKKK